MTDEPVFSNLPKASDLPEPDATLSLDAADSTYAAAPEDKDALPKPGPGTVQTLGKPGSGGKAEAKPAEKK